MFQPWNIYEVPRTVFFPWRSGCIEYSNVSQYYRLAENVCKFLLRLINFQKIQELLCAKQKMYLSVSLKSYLSFCGFHCAETFKSCIACVVFVTRKEYPVTWFSKQFRYSNSKTICMLNQKKTISTWHSYSFVFVRISCVGFQKKELINDGGTVCWWKMYT